VLVVTMLVVTMLIVTMQVVTMLVATRLVAGHTMTSPNWLPWSVPAVLTPPAHGVSEYQQGARIDLHRRGRRS